MIQAGWNKTPGYCDVQWATLTLALSLRERGALTLTLSPRERVWRILCPAVQVALSRWTLKFCTVRGIL
jgi:hypothetical protein